MSEWWTYTLSDFLLFSPRTWYRLIELYNAAVWPAQIVTAGLGLAILALLSRFPTVRGRWISAILAGCWLFVAIARASSFGYFGRLLAPVNQDQSVRRAQSGNVVGAMPDSRDMPGMSTL
jgi:hypothetical protein